MTGRRGRAAVVLATLAGGLVGCGDNTPEHALGPGTFTFDDILLYLTSAIPPTPSPANAAAPPPSTFAASLPGNVSAIQYGVGYMMEADATVSGEVAGCDPNVSGGDVCGVSINQLDVVLLSGTGDPVLEGARLSLDQPVSASAVWQGLALSWDAGGPLGTCTLAGREGGARTAYRITATSGIFDYLRPTLRFQFQIERLRAMRRDEGSGGSGAGSGAGSGSSGGSEGRI